MPHVLFDTHCHFDFDVFDDQRATLWKRCQTKHITKLMIPGTSATQWLKARELAEQYKGVYFSAGLHPWFIKNNDDWAKAHNTIQTLATHALCAAIGECGLDASIDLPMDTQVQVLRDHIRFANIVQKPIILHCVKAHHLLLSELKANPLRYGGVLHAFTGSKDMAENYIRHGLYLGVGGSITYARAKKTRLTLQHIPLNKLVLATDAPSMPLNGKPVSYTHLTLPTKRIV